MTPSCVEQAVDDVGVVPERVGERLVVGRRALAEARIVRRDHVVAIRERRDQIAEHVGRGGKPVQQEHGRRAGGAGFAVEDIDAVDLGRAIVDDRYLALLRYAGRRFGVSQRGRRDRRKKGGCKRDCGATAV